MFVSLFSILNILYSIYFNFTEDINSYIITFLISFIVGIFSYITGRRFSKSISLSEQISFVILTFIFIPLLISIPYFLSIYNISFLDSYFESVSGVTATGFSVLNNIDDIDKPLLLWRSSSQWLGGLFFLVAIIGTIGSKQIKIKPAYLTQGGFVGRNFYNEFNSNFIKILLIYFFSTLFIVFLFNLFGVRLLDSLHLAFTTISAGGFIPKEKLSIIINTDLQIIALSISLLFPIFNFYLLFNIITNKFELKKHQEDLHLGGLLILLIALSYFFIIPKNDILISFLSVITSISTSGIILNSPDKDLSLFFIILTVIGGTLISTSSGLKYTRFYILLKISYQEIYRLVKPINIFNKNLFNTETKIDDDDSKIAFLVFIIFIISIFILSSVLTLDYLSFENSFKLTLLTLTNTVTSPLYMLEDISFFALNDFSKISLVLFMIFGKVEIIAILFLIRKFIFRE